MNRKNYLHRGYEKELNIDAEIYEIIAIMGPRQAGKTTLAKETFPHHAYFSLEIPKTRKMICEDIEAFLTKDHNAPGIIIDEFQLEPDILSYLHGIIDDHRFNDTERPGYFILTGSHNFLMNQYITQSLAGRVRIFQMLPLSLKELSVNNLLSNDVNEVIFNGGYANIIQKREPHEKFYFNYVNTYLERDVHQLDKLVDLRTFRKFMGLCALRTGQLLNTHSLANDCKITVKQVDEWLTILEASYLIVLVPPYYQNYGKTLVKSNKLYFCDTGLACHLLGIQSAEDLADHDLVGNLFETLIVSEFYKKFYTLGKNPGYIMNFWRDTEGHELDCLFNYGYGSKNLAPIEIKLNDTVSSDFFKGLHYWCDRAEIEYSKSYLIYGGLENYDTTGGHVVSWQNAADVIDFK